MNAGSHSVLVSRTTVGQPADGMRLPEDPVRLAPSRRERILVGIRANERAIHLVRVGKRIADQCAADWTVVCVQTAGVGRANAEATELLSEAFRLAESLGAETVTLDGSSAAASLTHYALIRQASRIVVGARRRRGLRRIVRRDVASLLVNWAASAQVIVVTDAEAAVRADEYKVRRAGRLVPSDPTAVVWSRYLRALGITALCTAIAYPVYPHFDPVNIVMVYLLGTTIVGLRLGRGPSVLSAIGNVAAFDFFFVPPRYSFYFAETQYVFTFGVILGVALVIANLMVNVRRQTESAAARERRTATLYAMSRELGVARDAQTIAAAAARHVGAALDGDAVVLLVDDKGSLRTPEQPEEPGGIADLAMAEQTFRSGQSAGPGMQRPVESPCFYFPLSGGGHPNGVLVVRPVEIYRLLPEQQRLVEALAEQIALALERVRLGELAAESRAAAERAALRNTLLASISHDLRGPLSTIAGAGSLVAQSNGSLDRHRRKTLGHLIEEKARDMSQLLSNVLELMRLETTTGAIRADWQSLEELAGTAVRYTEHRLDSRRVTTNIPSDAPLAFLDGQLIVQLLSNLLENAAKHTPPSTLISIGAVTRGDRLVLTVEDDGPGFGTRDPQTLFEKFERGQVEGHVSGVGLGLAICRAIATLHGGEICAVNRPTGGARFEITLPLVPTHRPQIVANT
jgi:two-component system, OmpR family, sensor histidine kinase KdpD